MVDLLITNGTIVTVNDDFEVIENGAVAVDGTTIVDVADTDTITSEYDGDEVIDASGHAVLPGLITSHVHVSDILLRGVLTDRDDWLYNVKFPGVGVMDERDHAIASALYCKEALQSGVTTFVENAIGSGAGYPAEIVEAKFDVYDTAGIRSVYAQGFRDKEPSETFLEFLDRVMGSEPSVKHVIPGETVEDTQDSLAAIEQLIETYHGSADGRQSVWPAPYITWSITPEGFRGAYELAERYDVMTTTHVSQLPLEEAGYLTSIEYLDKIDYLGERALLGHCIHLDDRDIRILAESGAKVAHNPVTNLMMGRGFAPVPSMNRAGVTVGLGTDNTSASNTINMINDMGFCALIHKAANNDATAITAEKTLMMATRDNARAIGRPDLGSIEAGKKADIVLLDLDYPHLTPHHHNLIAAIVYQAQGHEVDTVICNGNVVLDGSDVIGVDSKFPDLEQQATEVSEEVVERAGLDVVRDNDRPY